MRHTLALLLFLLVSAPAGAQLSPVTGPFLLVDDTGKAVGGIELAAPGAGLVALSTPHGAGFVEYAPPNGLFRGGSVFFTSSDCTGQAYAFVGPGTPPAIGDGWPLASLVGTEVWAVTGPPASVTTASSWVSGGNPGGANFCNADSRPDQTLHPAVFVADLDAEFTPPFHIVTADSQLAAVPLHLGWLIAGVLLGLGVKAVGRR